MICLRDSKCHQLWGVRGACPWTLLEAQPPETGYRVTLSLLSHEYSNLPDQNLPTTYTSVTSIILNSNKIPSGDVPVPANLVPSGKWPLKWTERVVNHCLRRFSLTNNHNRFCYDSGRASSTSKHNTTSSQH